ncbi:MAG: hypothetical protein D4R48_03980 [Nitrosomonadales bacterium]|nr:MAG: hypothetical protein D4R48_03980 [Nitrosomonadales bacterium]
MDILQSSTLSNGGVQKSTGYAPTAKAPSSTSVTNTSESNSGAPAQPASAAQVKGAVDKINRVVQTMAADLKFSVDEGTGIHVVQVIDQSSKEVIRQIPSEEVIHIANGLDQLQGLLIKHKV